MLKCFLIRSHVNVQYFTQLMAWGYNCDLLHKDIALIYGGVEGPPHMTSCHSNSSVGDSIAMSYGGYFRMTYDRSVFNYTRTHNKGEYCLSIATVSHTDDLLTPPYDITTVAKSYVGLNISSVWHSHSTPISYGWLTNSSVWLKKCCYLIRTTISSVRHSNSIPISYGSY